MRQTVRELVGLRSESDMPDEVRSLLRHRIATRYYDDARIAELVARAILGAIVGSSLHLL
jgi:hypothetical protein